MAKDRYTFAGWYANTDLTGDPITQIPTDATGDKTFYAKWDAIPVTGIALSVNALTLTAGSSTVLTAAITPDNATDQRVIWEVQDNTIASVTVSGTTATVTGNKVGSTKIIARTPNVNEASCIVTVNPVPSVAVNPTGVTDLVYNAAPLALVTAGTSEHGQWEYSLDGGAYSSEIPTATDAGTYTVTCRFLPNKNYGPIDSVTIPVTIAPKALTVTANNQEIAFGASLPTLTCTGSGFAGSDTFITNPVCTTNANPYSPDTYTIVPSGADAGKNYTVTYKPGTLTVTPCPGDPLTRAQAATILQRYITAR